MRTLTIFFAVIAVASAVWATIAGYRMGAWLSRHGVKVNWFWYRALMPWYVHQYKKMTTARDGRSGPLFVQFVVTINVALVFAAATLVSIAIWKR